MTDKVQHPEHYTSGGIECIDAIRAALTPEEFRGYCKGNIIKYTWRERMKGGDQDIAKAGKYIEFLRTKTGVKIGEGQTVTGCEIETVIG